MNKQKSKYLVIRIGLKLVLLHLVFFLYFILEELTSIIIVSLTVPDSSHLNCQHSVNLKT